MRLKGEAARCVTSAGTGMHGKTTTLVDTTVQKVYILSAAAAAAARVTVRLIRLVVRSPSRPSVRRLTLLIPVLAALLLGGCGGTSHRAHLWLTPARGHEITACGSPDCGPWQITLNWDLPPFPGKSGYYTFLNGSRQGDVSEGPFTFTGSRCGVTVTLGVEAHNASGRTSPMYTTRYAAPACGKRPSCRCSSLQEVAGGAAYFADISSKSAWLDTVVPVGGWLEQPENATEVGYDSAMGNNFYWSLAGNAGDPEDLVADYNVIRCPSNPASTVVCAGGMHVEAPYADSKTGPETVGWQGYDESDGLGAGSGPWNTSSGCTSGACGYTVAGFYFSGKTTNVTGDTTLPYPLDGREVAQGFTQPVLFTDTNAQAAKFLTYSDFLSADMYWLTDEEQGSTVYVACQIESSSSACDNDRGPGFSAAQAALPANYGWNTTRLEALAAMNGSSKPAAADVETGCPGFSYHGTANCITPPQSVAAAWQALIAGARGIVWFQHNFNGPCETYTSFYQGSNPSSSEYNCQITPSNANLCPTCSAYTLHQMVKTITAANHEIDSLDKVLLSPTAVGEVSTSGDLSVMAKSYQDNRACYVFAGSGRPFNPPPTNQSDTFHLADDYTGTVTPVDGEGNALSPVTITNGTFTDTFANENAIHLYDIPAGC
jgi:hypothetical protein